MSTQPLPVVQPRRRRRRWPIVVAVLLVLIALAVVAFFAGDPLFRAQAEDQIEQSVGQNLPDGVDGGVTAQIHGFSALQQYVSGEFDHVTLRSSSLRVAGAPATATVQLYGLPVSGGTVSRATAALSVGQAAFRDIPALDQVNASDPVLGNGTVSTSLTQSILGLEVRVAVTLTPSLRGQVVRLTPTNATLTAGPASVPATAIVRQLLPNGVSVCAASYLPRGVELSGVTIRRGVARASLVAQDVDLEQLGSGRTGTCS